MTDEDVAEARAWYAGRHYDIGRDEMVAPTPPPACIAEFEARNAAMDRKWRDGMRAIYRAWRTGAPEPAWPSYRDFS